jgi:hypothetical protein
MKRICIVVGLVAGLALTLTATSFATPEIGRCKEVAAGTGKYLNAICSKKKSEATSNWEWFKGSAEHNIKGDSTTNTFSAVSGEAVLESESGTKIGCKTSTATGRYDEDGTAFTTKGVENVIAKFKTCEALNVAKVCTSEGQPEGEIDTFKLEGNLGDVQEKPTEIGGQELHPTPKGIEKEFARFVCVGLFTVHVAEGPESKGGKKGGDCIIDELSAVNEMNTTVNAIYKGGGEIEAGKPHSYLQKVQHFVNLKPPICQLESLFDTGSPTDKYEYSSQTETAVTTSTEKLEVKD